EPNHDRRHVIADHTEEDEDERRGQRRVAGLAVHQSAPPARKSSSRRFCRPSASKFSGSSHVSKAARSAGQSLSTMANQAVSRLWPLTTMCWRNTPSKVKPKRSAARFDGSFRSLHFHSKRR